jgi:hypothetical protein
MGSSKVARHLCLCFAGRRLVAAEVKGAVACWPSYVQQYKWRLPISQLQRPARGRGEKERQRRLDGGIATRSWRNSSF